MGRKLRELQSSLLQYKECKIFLLIYRNHLPKPFWQSLFCNSGKQNTKTLKMLVRDLYIPTKFHALMGGTF